MDTRNNPHRRLKTESRTQYLTAYNAISGILWFAVLGRVILLLPLVGFGEVYGGVGEWTKWTQTLALAEVLHSATGSLNLPIPPCPSLCLKGSTKVIQEHNKTNDSTV